LFYAQVDRDHQSARDIILGRLPDEFFIDLTYSGL
jgi:hypothetical protein